MEKYVSIKQMQERLGVSQAMAYQLAHAKGFPALKIGKKILVEEAKVDAWLKLHDTLPATHLAAFPLRPPRRQGAARGGRA
jgi:excisionase family DNA binding protein